MGGDTSQRKDKPRYGLGLSQRGHAIFVGLYAAVIVGVAAFGYGRALDIGVLVRDRALAMAPYDEAVRQMRAALLDAQQKNTSQPVADPAHPHRIASYPNLAQRRQEEGEVILDVLVLADGTVGDVRIEHSSGYVQLDAAALTGVGSWTYVPATRDHHSVNVWIRVRLVFALKS